jgi:hypothetical protein
MTNPFSSPAAPGAPEPAPRPRDLVGCLVAYSPREFTPAGAPGNTEGYDKGDPHDRVTADLIVLDTNGQAIAFGGFPEVDAKPRPHHLTVIGPARFDGVWIGNSTIVKALAPNGQPLIGQLILGRIVRSEFGRKPFNLDAVDGTPLMQRAIEIYTNLAAGQLQYNQPQPIPGVQPPTKANPAGLPMPPANSVSYGYAPAAATPVPMPPVAPAPVMPPIPQAPPAPVGPEATLAAAGFAPIPVAPPVPQPPVAPANGTGWGIANPIQQGHLTAQGWTVETWASLLPQQQAQVLATVPAF